VLSHIGYWCLSWHLWSDLAFPGIFQRPKCNKPWNDSNEWLVGGIPTPLKNMTLSVGMMKFPTEWKIIKFMFQTTNQLCSSMFELHVHELNFHFRCLYRHVCLGNVFSIHYSWQVHMWDPPNSGFWRLVNAISIIPTKRIYFGIVQVQFWDYCSAKHLSGTLASEKTWGSLLEIQAGRLCPIISNRQR
jgi:hypothetical protein